jgi:protoporphyrin/coproporphyrin ferrochelatase
VKPRVAIVLFNLGGPDRPEAIRPFLLNLFTDPAVLRVPFFIRPLLARIIARARIAPATENYKLLGGKSPLLALTREQAAALEAALPEIEAKCFIAMRYWHPMSLETVRAVKAWAPDDVVLLPLYPQFSTTTSGSSLTAWRTAAAQVGLVVRTTALCCYPTDGGYIAATAALVRANYQMAREEIGPDVAVRVLFSAHGLPEVIIKGGDPYQWQVEQTVSAVLAVLVVPIAFVSEHSETLVELDIEYRALAERAGVPGYFRVPTQNADPAFIGSLAGLVRRARDGGPGLLSHAGGRFCVSTLSACPFSRYLAPDKAGTNDKAGTKSVSTAGPG